MLVNLLRSRECGDRSLPSPNPVVFQALFLHRRAARLAHNRELPFPVKHTLLALGVVAPVSDRDSEYANDSIRPVRRMQPASSHVVLLFHALPASAVESHLARRQL